ncbi:hypothetical protein NE865_12544 [Phthorimaea operculella]|nr:hypothetical protein NE865_12544 [Phthorimaea operculella]
MSPKAVFALMLVMVAVFSASAENSKHSQVLSAVDSAPIPLAAAPSPRITCPLWPPLCRDHCRKLGYYKGGYCNGFTCTCII